MFDRTIIYALGHLLSRENWARERLRAFAGRHVRLTGGPLRLDLVVDGEGLFRQPEASSNLGEPDVVIELPADTPLRFILDRDSVFSAAKLSGAVDFAETLAFVFRNLRWDVEEDLARFTGDIVAHRLVGAGKTLFAWQKRAGENLVANVAEYLGEETRVVVKGTEVESFRSDLAEVREELARLERRLEALGTVAASS